jgi:hypothetical protein
MGMIAQVSAQERRKPFGFRSGQVLGHPPALAGATRMVGRRRCARDPSARGEMRGLSG